MWGKAFWKGAAERTIRAAAAALLATLTADKIDTLGSVKWEAYTLVATIAAVTSLLMSLVGSQVGPGGTPSTVEDRPSDPSNR